MNWNKKTRPNTVLGLTLDGGQMTATQLRRSNGSVEVIKSVTVALSLDLLRNEAELVGREVRKLLDAAGINEKRCVVGIPLNWVLSLHVKLPQLEEADVPSFLAIEAERGFPCNVEELQVSTSRHDSPNGDKYALLAGVPRGHLARLEAVLAAAQLKPFSFSLAITSLPGALSEGTRGLITAVLGESRIELLTATCGGVVTVRTLEGVFDSEGGEQRVQTELVARELRITLGQLPSDIRESVRQFRVVGSGRLARQLAEEIRPRADVMALSVEQITNYSGPHFGLKVNGNDAISPASSLAVQFLSGKNPGFEFLPPKPNLWQQMSSRYSSKRLVYAGGTAAVVVLIVVGMFAFKQIELSGLRTDWNKMKPKVTELEELQAQIRKYRPWYDETLPSLNILRRVTEAFPEDGVVSARMIEIRNGATVSCTGISRESKELTKMRDKLIASKQVSDVRTEQLRGTSPVQFSLSFRWEAPKQ